MATMQAAVVESFDAPPRCRDFPVPEPIGPDQVLVEVLAVGLHPRVRSGASGQHYASTRELPLIPGVDGVGRHSDGGVVYFAADDELPGPMAERAVIDVRRSVRLPAEVDVLAVAAAMNPAMSSWVALRQRVPIQPGQSVLVLGATGNAGTMAVQVAKLLGAGRVIGAGRDPERLAALSAVGADDVVALTDDEEDTAAALGAAAAEVDLVIDYLWGTPAERAIVALLTARADRSRAMDWIQIGAMAGPTIQLPSVALRSANFRLQGNGQGAISTTAYLGELPSLIEEINAGRLAIAPDPVPLAEVEAAWLRPDRPGLRTVIVPGKE
jgi:NADPH:quinone reductase-like Zn-dependent oxidoreductase